MDQTETKARASSGGLHSGPRTREAAPPDLVEVVRSAVVSQNVRRLTLAGPCLQVPSYGGDAYFRLFLPPASRAEMILPADPERWWPELLRIPETVRPVVRTYTVRTARPERGEIDVDVVRHPRPGPGSRWAASVKAGDTVGLLLQGRHHHPPEDVAWQLLVGDETAVPAIAAILEETPPGMTVHVIAEVPDSDDVVDLPTSADLSTTWLPRNGSAQRPGLLALEALRRTSLPPCAGYAWVAGEAAMVRAARRHLRSQAIPRTHLYTCGYWRWGAPAY